jgi:biopolymer transport protein ExbB
MADTSNLLDEYVIQGGVTMLALVPLSMYTLSMIIQKFLELRRKRIVSEELIQAAKGVKDQKSYQAFYASLKTNPSLLATLILDYIDEGERGESVDPKENIVPIDHQAEILYQSLSPISTAYIIGPLIGVLGTTVGIMATFRQFAIAGKRDMAALVSAIDKSLITTMWGLIIAVPAYFAYALLQNKIFNYERKILPKAIAEMMPKLKPYITSKK